MKKQPDSFTRYLPSDQQARHWGWRLLDVGRQNIPADAPYPAKGHPMRYMFDAAGRRTLSEYQVIFIATGSGSYESESTPCTTVHAGDALLLFPGEWHRYRPNTDTGWSEYWLGFKGQDAERVMSRFFDNKKPIQRISQPNEIIRLFDELLHWVKNPFPGAEQVMASFIPMILAFLYAGHLQNAQKQRKDPNLVMTAKSHMLKNLPGRTDLNKLAKSLGMSYSKFRNLFKEQTGYAPRAFENLTKLNRACDLLRSRQYTVSQTAETMGYASIYYFSRAFKKQFGKSPQAWLKICQVNPQQPTSH